MIPNMLEDTESAGSSRLIGHASLENSNLFDEEKLQGSSSPPPGPSDPHQTPTPRASHPVTSRPVLESLWGSNVYYSTQNQKRRGIKLYSCLLLFLVCLLFVFAFKTLSGSEDWVTTHLTPNHSFSSYHNQVYVKSLPTPRFRDNLVDGVDYVTAWPVAGFTNQFMAQVNLLYLASLAGRVPVLPNFLPSHMGGEDPGALPVSEVFDLPKLAKELRRPILEWKDMKNTSNPEMEDLGCWSVYETSFNKAAHPPSERDLVLDVSYTKVPDSARLPDFHTNIMSLASLGWPKTRVEALKGTKTNLSPQHQHTLQPDETMLCYDNLYYVAAARGYEWEYAWSPVWNLVGKHMTFNLRIETLTRSFVSRAFGLTTTDPFPEYISVHVRHTDFKLACHDKPLEQCFAPLSAFADKVKEVQATLLSEHGVNVDKVLVTSDETNQTWWDGVRELGWKSLDHEAEQTTQLYGMWYPILLDSASLSFAKGFVGTKGSTFSLLASRRVETWAGGPVRTVRLTS